MDKVIVENSPDILIIACEADFGEVDIYEGKRSKRALKSRLTTERCQGDRWAKALLYSHKTETGHFGIDFDTGKLGKYPWEPGSRD